MSHSFPLHVLLENLVTLFEREGTDYMIMGGIAVRFWGIPRPTYDLDFTLSISTEEIAEVCAFLEEEGFSVPEIHRKSFVDDIKGMKKFSVLWFHDQREIPVDMFLVTTEYQRAAFSRRVRKKLNGLDAWIISPEDLVLHKLIAGRERDLADALDVLVMTPSPEEDYLATWAAALDLEDELRRQLGRAKELDLS
jgi:hypothetical protein